MRSSGQLHWLLSVVLLVVLAGCNLPGMESAAARQATAQMQTVEAVMTAETQATDTPATTDTPEPSPTPTETPVPSATTPSRLARLTTDANCRSGPGTIYDVRQVLANGTSVPVVSKNADPNNVWIEVQPAGGPPCWLSIITVTLNFNTNELAVGVIPPTPIYTPGKIVGAVYHDYCDNAAGGQGCVAYNGGYRANGLLDLGELSIPNVTLRLGAGDCPSVGLTTATTGPGPSDGYEFDDLKPGKYCVTVIADADGNGSILGPGWWTSPDTNGSETARRTVTVESGATTAAVTFGWDFENQP
jgi:hypothetical protein